MYNVEPIGAMSMYNVEPHVLYIDDLNIIIIYPKDHMYNFKLYNIIK